MAVHGQGYIGRSPGDAAITVAREVFEPTGVQTDFTFASGYTPGYMDVFLNGVKLLEARDYEAGNGSTVGLSSYAVSGDVLELVAYKAFNLGQTVDQITGDLDLNGKLTVTGISSLTDVVSSGIVTADAFYGDGSTLSGLSTAAVPGISTQLHSVFGTMNVSGVATFAGNISVGGTITYDDVTNVDSVGIITAGKGFRATTGGLIVTAGVSTFTAAIDANSSADISGGVNLSAGNLKVTAGIVTVGAGVTVSSDFIHLADNSKVNVGAGSDMQIFHDGTHNRIRTGANLYINNSAGTETLASFIPNGASSLAYDDSTKITTASKGIEMAGIVTAIAGAAVTYYGDGSNLTGISAGGPTHHTNFTLESVSGNQNPINNWDVFSPGLMPTINTAVTNSSGIFSFPVTGIWQAQCVLTFSYNGAATEFRVEGWGTEDDGSNWDILCRQYGYWVNTSSTNYTTVATPLLMLDIQDTSNDKIKWVIAGGPSGGATAGDDSDWYSGCSFTRWCDT